MGIFSSSQKPQEIRPDSKPVERAKIVGVRPSYFNPHAITGDSHRSSVFFDVIFEYQDGTRDIFCFHGQNALRPYLQFIDLD